MIFVFLRFRLKIFSNPAWSFKYIFKPSKTRKFVIFSNNCGWFQLEFSPTMVLMIYKYILKPIKTSKFKIVTTMMDDWSIFFNQLKRENSKFSPTMVGVLSIFFSQWKQVNLGFSMLTMLDDL